MGASSFASRRQLQQPRAPQPRSRSRTHARRVKDIMTSIVDPEADVLWNAVATIVSLTGTEEREPKTDEEWAAVRRSAVQLVEATNLLRIPGRLVARPGEKSENPRIELQPETIQKMIAEDPARWTRPRRSAPRCCRARPDRPSTPETPKGSSTPGSTSSTPAKPATSGTGIRRKKRRRGDTSLAGASTIQSLRAVPTGKGGTITGHIAVKGKVPGNQVIRMGMDPGVRASSMPGSSRSRRSSPPAPMAALRTSSLSLQGSFPADAGSVPSP